MKRMIYVSLVAAVSIILVVGEASVQPPGPTPGGLAERVAALEAAVLALQTENATQQGEIDSLRTDLTTVQNDILALQAGIIPNLGNYVSVVTGEIKRVKGPHVIFKGANVHIRSGSGLTGDGGSFTGFGTLIVGYNEDRVENPPSADVRWGSHNIVVGTMHYFSSVGGFVAGVMNTISGPYSSVTGGSENTASGGISSVSGGIDNEAGGYVSSVSGGYNHDVTATGTYDWAAGSLLGGSLTSRHAIASTKAGLFGPAFLFSQQDASGNLG